MIQFNLLPDVKVEYIKARRLKRTVLAASIIITSAAVGLMAVMGALVAAQKAHFNALNKDIKASEDRLRDTPDLNKILTIQNQLQSLPDLYKKRPQVSRLFTYVEQTTPKGVALTRLTVDFKESKITVEGNADSYAASTQYTDTLKFTKYSVQASEGSTGESKPAFTDVIWSNFNKGEANKTNYAITFKFDPTIFDETKQIALNVPTQITTRSVTERPLFDTGGK